MTQDYFIQVKSRSFQMSHIILKKYNHNLHKLLKSFF